MKTPRLTFLVACAVLFAGAGCGSLDVSSSGNPDRVLRGAVNAGAMLPEGSEIVVRLVAAPGAVDMARPATTDAPVMTRPSVPGAERVLGEHKQTLSAATSDPVAFRIEFYAEDALLRRGLNLDVRVSVGGRLRYRTVNGHVVTLASSPYPQEVNVQAVAQ
jgi:uncharacterized lipoprotein YbaY